MHERLPRLQAPESILRLQYPAGWEEIMTAPDAAEYQVTMGALTGMTYRICAESGASPDWTKDTEAITSRWQRAVEYVADAAIDPADILTEAERIEQGLLTLQANIEGIGWEEEGLSFVVPNIVTGEETLIDLRQMQSMPDTND